MGDWQPSLEASPALRWLMRNCGASEWRIDAPFYQVRRRGELLRFTKQQVDEVETVLAAPEEHPLGPDRWAKQPELITVKRKGRAVKRVGRPKQRPRRRS
jgi:hypothetical protein